MAVPFGGIAAALIVAGNHHHNNNNDFNSKHFEDMATLLKNQNLIFEYLKRTFKAHITQEENYSLESTIYHLKFFDIHIGIQLTNELIINEEIEFLYRYSYDPVFKELIKKTKREYIQGGDE